MEQSFCQWRGQQRKHAARASGFAKQGHVSRVAAKRSNVIPHPFERGDLVQQGKIMHNAIFFTLQCRMGKEAKMTEAIVDRDYNHTAHCQRFAVIGRQAPGTNGKPAAVQPDHHRKRFRALFGRPDVEIETIFRKLARIAAA